MKFVVLAKDFVTCDPDRPLLPIVISKGTRFGIRNDRGFDGMFYGDGFRGDYFYRCNHFGPGVELKIPVDYLTPNSLC